VSQITNRVRNPSAETNTTDYTAVPGTTGAIAAGVVATAATTAYGTKVARCTWTTASTAAGGGMYCEIDVATAGLAVGDVISAGIYHLLASIGNRIQISVEFRTNVANISTSSATAKQLTAATVYSATSAAELKLENLTIPATCTKIRIRALTVAGTGYANWSIGSYLQLDGLQINRGATLQPYIDGSRGYLYAWAGTAHASLSTFYTPAITLTPVADDAAPGPRVQIAVDDIPPTVAGITLYRTCDRRRMKVRGAVKESILGVGAYGTQDVEAGFSSDGSVESTYRAQLLDINDAELGYTDTATTALVYDQPWIHNVLDPYGAAQIDVEHRTAMSLKRRSEGEIYYAERRTLGVLMAGQRHGVEGVGLHLSTTSKVDADKFQDMLGTYDDADEGTGDRLPLLCIRTPAPWDRLPRTFFAAVLEIEELPLNVHMGGQVIEFSATADETAPPFPGIVVPLLTRNDIDAFYATRNALDAAYARRIDIDRDYSKAGTA
jgi:hypothetical protein